MLGVSRRKRKSGWRKKGGVPVWFPLDFKRDSWFAPSSLKGAVRACGLLHDFGQVAGTWWQRWAAAAQRAEHGDY